MDVAILSKDSLKIKIKKTSLVLNPRTEITKTEADAIIATDKKIDESRINDYRVLIDGAGEYEVSGLKILSYVAEDGLVFNFIADSTEVILAKASILSKIPSEKQKEYGIAIIDADVALSENVITSIEPRIIVLYGENAKEVAKSLGKEVNPTSKVSFSEDKLPEETEIYLLS